MSAGVHSGDCHFFLTRAPHRELLVAGPGATRVFELEDLATAGEIVLSAETAAAVDPAWLAEERDGARLMQRARAGRQHGPAAARRRRRATSTNTSRRRCARTSPSRAARPSTAR